MPWLLCYLDCVSVMVVDFCGCRLGTGCYFRKYNATTLCMMFWFYTDTETVLHEIENAWLFTFCTSNQTPYLFLPLLLTEQHRERVVDFLQVFNFHYKRSQVTAKMCVRTQRLAVTKHVTRTDGWRCIKTHMKDRGLWTMTLKSRNSGWTSRRGWVSLSAAARTL